MMQRINPRHEFCPDDISLLNSAHLAQPTLLTSSRVTDLYLLALARHHGAKLATFDGRIPAEAVPDGRRHLAVIRT
jgi:predicted nucleic acid-binding protein